MGFLWVASLEASAGKHLVGSASQCPPGTVDTTLVRRLADKIGSMMREIERHIRLSL